MNLHPDDFLFFNEVAGAMRRVARHYELPLRSVTAYPMPLKDMADRLGDCTGSGDIRLVMRATVDGVFVDEPRSPQLVWDTAAHELAHLRHMNHGVAFQELRLELITALTNQQVDHRDKVLARLVKMRASRDGEAKLGNAEAAEAFASVINRMLLENELSPSDIDYARTADNDPVIEVRVNLGAYKIAAKHSRVAWQESLARIVAQAHLCTFLIQTSTNNITFVGTRSHATVAEYAFGTLVPATDTMSLAAAHKYRTGMRKQHHATGASPSEWLGFRESWLNGFIGRIAERFKEAREAAVAEAPEGPSTALIRLDGALIKTRTYIDNKFKGRRGASALNQVRSNHSDGVRSGRAAADRVVLGRRGLTGSSNRKMLT
ncbi:MAG: DUF45 domain-containing protein [Sulfuricaulis sp.]|nr:DUF45 domain-containing protein [Sulfuricaulis sp.]